MAEKLYFGSSMNWKNKDEIFISVVSDPYCVVFCEKKKVTTRVIRNNINPEFNERITFYHRKPDEDITVEVSLILYFKNQYTVNMKLGSCLHVLWLNIMFYSEDFHTESCRSLYNFIYQISMLCTGTCIFIYLYNMNLSFPIKQHIVFYYSSLIFF